jgi:methanogenic corrinoid protein MtbC1
MHQIGLLNLVVMLRWRGWNVKYFGQDLAFDRILETLNEIKPDAILFSATQPVSVEPLMQFNSILEQYPFERPLLIFGGAAFRGHILNEYLTGEIIDLPPSQAIERIEKLMIQRTLRLSK